MTSDADKSQTMKLYFTCMDTADFDTAASLFADEAVYVRPPFVPGQAAFASSGTQRIDGLPAIRAFWDQRGKRATHHVIVVEAATEAEWFAEGVVSVDESEERLFLSHVTFDAAGKVQRFVALR